MHRPVLFRDRGARTPSVPKAEYGWPWLASGSGRQALTIQRNERIVMTSTLLSTYVRLYEQSNERFFFPKAMATAMPKPVRAEIEPEQTDGATSRQSSARTPLPWTMELIAQSARLILRCTSTRYSLPNNSGTQPTLTRSGDRQPVRLLVNDRKFPAGNSVFLSHQTSQQ